MAARWPRFAVLLATLFASSCASIPREAPELSTELGRRIGAIEAAHIQLLYGFMDEKRARVDALIQDEYLPAFAEELFSMEPVVRAWETAAADSATPETRLEFIVGLGTRVQARINQTRTELIAPLDAFEQEAERRLRAEYAQVRSINNVLTSFLANASEVDANRERVLGMLGVSDEDVSLALDEVSKAVDDLVQNADQIDSFKDAVTSAADKLRPRAGDGS